MDIIEDTKVRIIISHHSAVTDYLTIHLLKTWAANQPTPVRNRSSIRQLSCRSGRVSYNGRQIKERHCLKLNEVHYFDNAGLGMLMRVSRTQ